MSNSDKTDEFENWLGSLDTGRHYRDSDAYMSLVYEQISSDLRGHHPPGKSPRSDTPVHASLPRGRFEEVVHVTRKSFVEALENGETKRLRRLEESLPTRLEVLQEEVSELSQRIDSVDNVQDRFSELDEQYDSLDEAAGANVMPEELEPHGLDYLATGSLGGEVDFPIYLGEESPLRVAAHARLIGQKLCKERKPKRVAMAVGRLRLRILQYALSHFEITGRPPKKLSEHEVKKEAEKRREESKKEQAEAGSKGGRPPKVAEHRDVSERDPAINKRLKSPAFYKKTEGGNLRTRDGKPLVDWQEMRDSIDEDLFLSAGPDAVRAHANSSSNVDLDEKRQQMKEREEEDENAPSDGE